MNVSVKKPLPYWGVELNNPGWKNKHVKLKEDLAQWRAEAFCENDGVQISNSPHLWVVILPMSKINTTIYRGR